MNNVGPQWTDGPVGDEGERNYKMKRPKGNKPLQGVCISRELIGTYLHWWKGKSVPCTGVDLCDACKAGQEKEKKYWIVACDADTLQRFICEITSGCIRRWKEIEQHFGTLNGVCFKLSRTNGLDNGPMHAEFKKDRSEQHQLTDFPDLQKMLYRMWRYDPELTARLAEERIQRELAIRAEAEAFVLATIEEKKKASKVKARPRKRS